MSSADGSDEPECAPVELEATFRRSRTDTNLVEALMHVLIEKGLLTKNDALSVVETVANIERGWAENNGLRDAMSRTDMAILRQMYQSFEFLADQPRVVRVDGEKVVPLRPHLHDNRPEFPEDD